MTVPLSILDLAPISAGSDAATALRNTVDLARHAELWGYRRYWVAEHHYVAVASSSPAVLIGQIAAATTTIRVGAAAVQLGHTTPVAVVESFGILDAFHPGRIDLGVGRSGQRRTESLRDAPRTPAPPRERHEVDGVVVPPPFDVGALMRDPRLRAVMATLQQPGAVAPDFGEQVADILALLDGSYRTEGFEAHVTPGESTTLRPWIFGSSKGQSAQVAGALGLPFVAAYHIAPGTALEAVTAYRKAFRPSAGLAEPYVVVSADVLVADDDATARQLAASYGHWVYSIRAQGGAAPYPDPDTVAPLTAEQRALVQDRTETQFVGNPDTVADRLAALQRVTGADELVITSVAYRHEDRLRSHELIAKRWAG
ncbi:LLM class flavin-dependent oxidoreductase [Mycolicibacterium cosmeticum]|uniref:F420-dependent methylene-tetrahydromethanopterin reductase n=1 Tax=Mycolicibacterium cosmeticum TaxID=258533 RepID=W9B3H4_MYCCO|nr:LLM class flavin-dependent oxidoreductase [Mycolicibacterium cosmeticum]TLH74930.1 LLM class flavin-dependent oxidoreductase [Mycolicibacterium cosmeticum]CDO09346.1 F420-dependent methylene-tetrahydromethanopterin reductase [Mycolicibacterium cosmeticum]